MLDAIVGGLIGSGLALIGTFLTVRDSRWGRTLATEEKASAILLAQLRRLRHEDRLLQDHRAGVDFMEDCLSAILAFRDSRVRRRLTASLNLLVDSDQWARSLQAADAAFSLNQMVHHHIRECIEARLDRKRLPDPPPSWAEARGGLVDYLTRTQDDIDAAMEAHEVEREEAAARWESGL
ncbi:hypothetical protein OG564_17695 [Streptomyces sp. NBC_01280]|uniref:hypothetical protein n=1 Tax=Streptomyces sp. NBC_01280 TaxID=2903810 RepID=UPI002E3790C7|nr:hypothetical protein [Streptomyces sp. NBC_01280]